MVDIIGDNVKKPYYDENLKTYIDSKGKRNKLLKQKGLTFAGDYSKFCPKPKSIGKEHLPTREQLQKMLMTYKYKLGGKLVK